jgi:hypothetical protein
MQAVLFLTQLLSNITVDIQQYFTSTLRNSFNWYFQKQFSKNEIIIIFQTSLGLFVIVFTLVFFT